MKQEKQMTNAEKYQRWDEIREASEKRSNAKRNRKLMLKKVMKLLLIITFALPIILIYVLSGSIVGGITDGFSQLGEDHERIRRNKHRY